MEIISIKDCPGMKEALVQYCVENWPPVSKGFIRSLEESLTVAQNLPFTFLGLKDNKIVGFYQLLEQECIVHKDKSPWISPLFIDPNERGNALGAVLLEHGRKTAGNLGYKKVYLTTDHIQYYEKYGFREIGLDNFEWGRPTKIYEHDTIMD